MVETARYTKLFLEDIALGLNTRQVRLADQATYPLTEVHISGFLLTKTLVVQATTFNGQPAMTLTAFLPANRRVWGVTVENQVALGATGGLTGYYVGDPVIADRWSSAPFPLTAGFTSDEGDFADPSLMIYPTDTDLIITGLGGLFDATGRIEVTAHLSFLRHPT